MSVRIGVRGPSNNSPHDAAEMAESVGADSRDRRQRTTIEWVRSTFGEAAATPSERALRLLEEVVELVQAEGVDVERVRAIVSHVYGKPIGQPAQEVGGVGVCLLAYCAATDLSADAEESRELDRVLAVDPAYFRARHNAKADAGIAVRAPEVDSKG